MRTITTHKTRFTIQNWILAGALTLTLHTTTLEAVAGKTNTATAAKAEGIVQPPYIEPAIPQSTFNQPKKLADGRNPFFPQSVKHIGFEAISRTTPAPAPQVELVLSGISGTAERPLAIINNRTLTAGEEADVPLGTGKIRIRCQEINMADGTVLVQVGGQSRQLRLPPK